MTRAIKWDGVGGGGMSYAIHNSDRFITAPRPQKKSLLTRLRELESRLELIDVQMRQCIAGQRRIKGYL